jgi:hypothetical protein
LAGAEDLLARLAAEDLSEARTLALITDLRRTLPLDLASAVLTLARLRVRAAEKFSRADSMFFTPDALEQSSGERIARWCARRFAGYATIADLGCGIGGDTLALNAETVIALDWDAERLRMARANVAAYGGTASFVQADLTQPLPFKGIEAGYFDPARRFNGKRIFSVWDYRPPLDLIETWDFRALGVKLSPGVDLDELRRYTDSGAGIEFVSVGGELKEALLWRGDLGFQGRWASRLDSDGGGDTLIPLDLPAPPLSEPRAFLYEPDPAVIRAGLLSEMGQRLDLPVFRLDESIAYLTADTCIRSPWARVWPVWEWMPFNLKRLRATLRARGIGRVTVKKRGSPITPEDLIRQLKLDGSGESAVVVLTRIADQPAAIICGEMV